MKNSIILFFTLLIASCQPPNSSSHGDTANTEGYTLTNVSGTEVQLATKVDANGNIIEQGQFLNNTKTGQWITYFPDKNLPKTISSYVADNLNGQHMELSNRGQITLMANYKNGVLDGHYSTHKFGRLVDKANYKDGQLEGTYLSYHNNSDKVQKEVQYKGGKQDGFFRQYDEEGNMIIEYIYKNGEVVSGGMIDTKTKK